MASLHGCLPARSKTSWPFMPPAEPPPSPFAWGREERVVWGTYVNGFGPTKILAASLDAEKRAALERDFIAVHEKFRTPMGLAMPREYLVTIGIRK